MKRYERKVTADGFIRFDGWLWADTHSKNINPFRGERVSIEPCDSYLREEINVFHSVTHKWICCMRPVKTKERTEKSK
jgi:hypothetical protein